MQQKLAAGIIPPVWTRVTAPEKKTLFPELTRSKAGSSAGQIDLGRRLHWAELAESKVVARGVCKLKVHFLESHTKTIGQNESEFQLAAQVSAQIVIIDRFAEANNVAMAAGLRN